MEVYKWIEDTQPWQLSICDLDNITIGKTYDILLLDKNFDEVIWDNVEENTPMKPTEFFKHNMTKITYEGNYTIKMFDPSYNDETYKLHVSTEGLATNWCWSKLSDTNEISITSESRCSSNNATLPSRKEVIPISNFPRLTKIGWRGPIIVLGGQNGLNDLNDFQDVMWTESAL